MGGPQNHAPASTERLRFGGWQTRISQRLQRQVLTHQQVARALVHWRVTRRGELDEDVAPGRDGAKLGLLATRRGATQRALHACSARRG